MENIYRIEIFSNITDTRALSKTKRIKSLGISGSVNNLILTDVYSINKAFLYSDINKFSQILANPLISEIYIYSSKENIRNCPKIKFDYAIEIGFLPGVTDNSGNTAREMIEDFTGNKFTSGEGVYFSQVMYINGRLDYQDIEKIGQSFANPLIYRICIKSFHDYQKDYGMNFYIPKVRINQKTESDEVDLNINDKELADTGIKGIPGPDGTRHGPLALEFPYMKAIKKYFQKIGRNPTDIELESLAQTWSEHCKHTIFADPLDDIKDGLYKTYIKKATELIRRKKGKNDLCVSVFSDNSGAIQFDDEFLITHKVETHNTPSALDPFGGSITGIVGVNRDAMGFGLGAKPIANFYGFCLANPAKDTPLYKDQSLSQKMLSSRRIMDGVIEGVNAGGNQSGIPTPLGFLYFDERYRGKPLVFVGTVGIIPNKIKNKPSYIKKAKKGDYIVMAGGRVGKDGIHGATFSSIALDENSPVTAVQIGDPITQKKMSDVLIKEARDKLLYNSITDNGAGGLSCSVAEMARESNGCEVFLEKVPVKYPGLSPWEIWVSESQERMTLSVSPRKWPKLSKLLKSRGVEATVIGKFTNTGKCVVTYKDKIIMDITLKFLHEGLPERKLKSSYSYIKNTKPVIIPPKNLTETLLMMLARPNIAGFEFISSQYDHMVQGNLVIGPLQGKGRVNGEASIIRPRLDSRRGLIMSQGLYPSYSDIDTYHMAASSIDTAVRNIVAMGGNSRKIFLLDNFCWCSSFDPYRLGQLKRAVKACYDLALIYETPFISGKDSMFNDFHGFDEEGKPVNISIPPTLLITSLGIIENIDNAVTIDSKADGDLIYLLGDTYDEIGATEYLYLFNELNRKNEIGSRVPKVDAPKNLILYKLFYQAVKQRLIASSISVTRGGLGVSLTKMSIAGKLGCEISLKKVTKDYIREDVILFSESQGRIIATVAPQNRNKFEKIFKGVSLSLIGKVTAKPEINIIGIQGKHIIKTNVAGALNAYKATFKNY